MIYDDDAKTTVNEQNYDITPRKHPMETLCVRLNMQKSKSHNLPEFRPRRIPATPFSKRASSFLNLSCDIVYGSTLTKRRLSRPRSMT